MNGIIYYVVFCDRPLSFCILISRFLCVVELHSFLWPGNIPLYAHTIFYVFILQSVGVCVVCAFLAVVNNTAVNIGVWVFMWMCVSISLGYIPRSGIAGSHDNSLCKGGRTARLFFNVAALGGMCEASTFSLPLPALVNICLIWAGMQWVGISLWLWFAFP